MDSFANSQDASSTSNRKRKAEDVEKELMLVIPSKRARFYETYRRQPFTLPDSIMHYIAKNPSSPEIYAKMVQTCKYFFVKNPILVISELFCYDHDLWQATYNGKRTNIDLDKVTSKLWLTNKLIINRAVHIKYNLASLTISKMSHCDITTLTLSHQIISFNELLFLSNNVENMTFFDVTVKNEDGAVVKLEKIVEVFSRVKSIKYACPSTASATTFNTLAELLKLPQFLILDFCGFKNMPENFDIEGFYAYMKKNKRTRFELGFSDDVSDAYRTRLEEIVNEIIDSETHVYKPPIIAFRGLTFSKFIKMCLSFAY